jgi:hypothetical protein
MKYWEMLLTNQRKRGRDGLTIPFIIGSQKYLPENHVRQNIKDLILDLTTKSSFETCLRFCMGTQTFILEIKKPKNITYSPTLNQNEQEGLSIAVFDRTRFGNSVEEVIEKTQELFQQTIDAEKFSAEPNVEERTVKWGVFSANEDIPFIKSSFGEK